MDSDDDFVGSAGGSSGSGAAPVDELEVGEEKEITAGLKKKLLAAGSGPTPSKGSEVKVHYVGTLLDGTEFDSSRGRDTPFVFTLGQGSVIKGWDKGVATMRTGEKCILTCAPDMAYGEAGSGEKIPPNSTLQFEVELLEFDAFKDLKNDGGVRKRIVKLGSGWETPRDKFEVQVHMTTRAGGADAEVVGSTAGGEPLVISLDDAAPRGLVEAIKSMKKGEKAEVILRDKYVPRTGHAHPLPADADRAFLELELVAMTEIKDVLDNGGVLKKTLKEGEGWDTPKDGATVKVDITYKTRGGDVLGETKAKEFILGKGEVMDAVDLGLEHVKKGETALLVVRPEYTKALAVDGSIAAPDGDALHVEVHLHEFTNGKKEWELKGLEAKVAGAAMKDDGNRFFAAGSYARAEKKYEQALKYLDKKGSDEVEEGDNLPDAKTIKMQCHLNLANVHLKLKRGAKALASCNKALELDASSVKGLFRRGSAHAMRGDHNEAIADFKAVLERDPMNKDAKGALARAKKALRETNAKQQAVFSKMFAAGSA